VSAAAVVATADKVQRKSAWQFNIYGFFNSHSRPTTIESCCMIDLFDSIRYNKSLFECQLLISLRVLSPYLLIKVSKGCNYSSSNKKRTNQPFHFIVIVISSSSERAIF